MEFLDGIIQSLEEFKQDNPHFVITRDEVKKWIIAQIDELVDEVYQEVGNDIDLS